MRTVVLDFETYYDRDYSLRNMTPVEYILDPRYETIMCGVKEAWPGLQPTRIINGRDFGSWVKDARLEEACVVSHNALFDMCILAWRYNVVPRLMIDTLGVSRAVLGHQLKRLHLAGVADFLQLGRKGNEVVNMMGLNLATIEQRGLFPRYGEYCANDTDLCAGIYDKLVRSGHFPMKEVLIMDMVLRCAIQPKFLLDQGAIAQHLADVQQSKLEILASAMLAGAQNGKSDLMSNEKFAEVLRGLGVDPPRKISKLTGLWTYAFAKTDKEFMALEEHPDTAVQVLVAARTKHKSTLEESRSERLLKIANLTWQGNEQKLMPVPLRYGGAHTHRLSGDWKLNMQNLPRGGNLRRALIAKPGHVIMTVDASQIEARITAWLCGQTDLVQAFANGDDVYSLFASELFGYLVGKKTHPRERFIGKTSILALGYQVGSAKFQNAIETQSLAQLGMKVDMPPDQAETIVQYYRKKYFKISGTWNHLQQVALPVLAGNGNKFTIGPCEFETYAVMLPSGLRLHYYDLHLSDTQDFGRQWIFSYGEEPKALYGGKLLENMVQALARIHTMDAALRIQKSIGLGMQVHDELVYSVPEGDIGAVESILMEEMIRPPSWAPGLPLAAEVGVGPSYGDAK